MKGYRELFWTIAIVMAINMAAAGQTLHVDSRIGSDENSGTKEKPLRTIAQAASVVNGATAPGPTTIKIAPGIYNLTDTVVFKNARPYTEKDRLTIRALILPDDPDWKPALMPALLSTQAPGKPGQRTETYSLKVKINHVTIRGLKFLGNPLLNNWHACIERVGEDLDDLLVTQCMFVGDQDTLNIYCPAIATGNRFIVDHCIFYNCNASAVFWDGLDGIGGKGCAMRYCIVSGCRIAGPWTCQTTEDFEFHHNIVTGCDYFWMRKPGDRQKYRVRDCTVTDNKYYCGKGGPGGPWRQTGPQVTFDEKNVIKQGQIQLEKDKKTRNYLHVIPGGFGSNLAAGLFTK
jgi:hypothetical protein